MRNATLRTHNGSHSPTSYDQNLCIIFIIQFVLILFISFKIQMILVVKISIDN
jgi:hypothetical protein